MNFTSHKNASTSRTLSSVVFCIYILIMHSQALLALDFNLNQYRLSGKPIVIEGVKKNASGLAYHEPSDTIYVIINGPTEIVQIKKTGEFIRSIKLKGFSDPEGITWLHGKLFAVAEEVRARICIFELNNDTKEVNIKNCKKIFRVDNSLLMLGKLKKNGKRHTNGLESLAYDARLKAFWTAKEKRPEKIYFISLKPEARRSFPANEPWPVEYLGLKDISGIFPLPNQNNLLILSDRSSQIIQVNVEGKIKGHLKLSNRNYKIKNAEGITVDKFGVLYVCAEPNILCVYKPLSN